MSFESNRDRIWAKQMLGCLRDRCRNVPEDSGSRAPEWWAALICEAALICGGSGNDPEILRMAQTLLEETGSAARRAECL